MKNQTRRNFFQISASAAALALATAGFGQKQTSTENSSDKSEKSKKDQSKKDEPKKTGSLEIAVLLFDGMTALDAIGPYEVLSLLPNAVVKFVGETAGPILVDSKMLTLRADYSIDEVPKPDILLIPGGDARGPSSNKKILDWITNAHKTTKYTSSVCTGALILGAAELLRGKKATTYWASTETLVNKYGAEFVQERYVQSGKILTAAGVSAGIDAALYLAEKLSDRQTAQVIQLFMEYDPQPPFEGGSLRKADKATVEATRKYLGRGQ